MKQNIPDNELIKRVKDSDMEAFRLLFEHYQPILFRQVNYQAGEADLAHDIVQQTFIKVWEHRRSLYPDKSFLSYIFRISRNLLLDIFKHQNIRFRANKDLPIPEKSERDDPAEALELTLLEEKIKSIINSDLPPRCREIFLLSRFEGRSNREIADLLQLSVRTVEHQINYALKAMRKKLK
ncbi:MAG: RNA polymerase sigma-70 factor [Bacteroidetes bacterium]|nr:RNA polymerase sigma-70 factor [Bacteroidota bacterium]